VKNRFLMAGLIPALTLTAASAMAAPIIVNLDQPWAATQFFNTTDTGPDDSFSASFGATPKIKTTTNGAFDYQFDFIAPSRGTGSASFSASFSSPSSGITSVSFDGHTYAYPTPNTNLTIAPFQILAGQHNVIEVIGNLGTAQSLIFDGTAIFTAVPEPTTWAMFLVGFGFIGMALRRKLLPQFQTA